MKRSIESMVGFSIDATDGEIGKVAEFYFDDQRWTIRYLVVKTGSWLFGRKVLISPQALQTTNWANRSFPVNLSKEQVRNSPDVDTDKPVSRQQEELLHAHYPWPAYWDGAFASNGVWGILPAMPIAAGIQVEEKNDHLRGDAHLGSTHSVTGYRIHATDGEIGIVTDYMVDDTNWELHYLVVKTGSKMKPEKILLSTKWIIEVNWADSAIIVDISLDRLKRCRPYDETKYIDSAYEQMIFDHYGKPMPENKTAHHR